MVLKCTSQIITQICKLMYGQWLHHIKLKHAVESLDDNTKEIIVNSEITDKHEQVQDTLPTAITHTLLHSSPQYYIPRSRQEKIGTTSSRRLER